MKPSDWIAVIGVALILLFPKANVAGLGSKVPTKPAPAAELQSLLAPVKTLLASHPQNAEFAAFSLAAADALQRDAGQVVKTPAVLASFNASAVRLRFTGTFQQANGLSAAIDEAMLKWVGAKAEALTPERTRKAVEFYQGLAWAAGG